MLCVWFCLIAVSSQVTAQDNSFKKIEVEKVFGGYNFMIDGGKMKMNKLIETMKSSPIAYQKMKSARNQNNLATATACTGGFLMGWQLGNAISGEPVKWGMVALGGGIALVSIPLTKKSFKKAISAVGLYNSSFGNTSHNLLISTELKLCSNGEFTGFQLNIPISLNCIRQ